MRKSIVSADLGHARPAARWLGALLGTALLVSAPGAIAQDKPAGDKPAEKAAEKKGPDKKTREAARDAYGAGEKAYASGDYAAAFESFKKAFELIPGPHASYWMAMSLDQMGKVPDAIASFDALLSDPDVAKIGEEKLATAKTRLEALRKSPGKVSLVTTPAGAAVAVDGTAQMGETPMELELAAGKHELAVTAPGHETKQLEIIVKPGEKSEEKLELVPKAEEPPPPVAPPPEPEPAPPAAPAPPPEPKSKVPAYVTLGIAGASTIVGTIFGLKAMSAKGDFDDSPTTDSADDVEKNALIADMAFGVAITLGVTGIVLLTSDDGGEAAPAEAARRRAPSAAKLRLVPHASPSGGGASARWTF